ncbi:MAG: DUF1848 domain-containing protein [Fimbriimonadaceae bacterium]|nr:DUF1848 domain-containing protein [Fimbriimonadaceae bacterium]
MIISASRKTDLPAFYGEWFRNRLRAGYCRIVSAYNRSQHATVSLQPGDVDGFVFWTKNVGPFLPALADVADLHIPFVVQYTVNPYPREIEPSGVASSRTVVHCRRLAEQYGPRVVVWRYDPILLSDLTPAEWHLQRFERLAEQLAGTTDEVVTKYVVPYRKTKRNLDHAAAAEGFQWCDPSTPEKLRLLQQMASCAAAQGITLKLCCQPELRSAGLPPAVCVDAVRLAETGGRSLVARTRPSREGCHCAGSADIGEYDSCPHGCVYCYAVQHQRLARQRYRRHDPTSEYLFAPEAPAAQPSQPTLF